MRILILGDSLTFPRPKYNITYEDSWPGLLSKAGHEIFLRGKGGSNILDVEKEVDHLSSYFVNENNYSEKPFDIIILQVGIVDLTPRIFSPFVKKTILKIPVLRKIVTPIHRNKFFYKYISSVAISEKQFEKSMGRLHSKFSQLANNAYLIEIAKPTHNLLNNVGDFSENVIRYNLISRLFFEKNLLEVYKDSDILPLFLPDGHHLSLKGHFHVAEKLLFKLNNGK